MEMTQHIIDQTNVFRLSIGMYAQTHERTHKWKKEGWDDTSWDDISLDELPTWSG